MREFVMKFFVTEKAFNAIESRIKRINKKGEHNNIPPITMKVVGEKMTKVDLGYTKLIEIELDSATPKIEGWDVIAAIHHRGDICTVFKVDSSAKVPQEYIYRKPFCDHCQTRRLKVHSFILKREDSEQYMQVGSTCLEDFVGVNVSAIIYFYNSYEKLVTDIGKLKEKQSETLFDADDMLAVSIRYIKENGFFPASSQNATRDVISRYFRGEHDTPIEVNEEDRKAVEGLKEFYFKHENNSSFNASVCFYIREKYVSFNAFSFLVAAANSYLRSQKKSKNQVAIRNEYVGKYGETLNTTVKILKIQEVGTRYGTSYLHKMLDSRNHLLIWFASKDYGFKVGEEMDVTLKVKTHKEYNGVKQTYVSRVKKL